MKYFTKREDTINGLLSVLLVLILFAIAVQRYNYKADERFEWGSGVLSSKGNVVQVSSCHFHHAKDWNYDDNKENIIDDGWDDINYINLQNDVFYPDSLSISWFSYIEKKFYKGKFILPYKIILEKAKHLRMNKKRYGKNYSEEDSNKVMLRFLAEILPNGKLAVWISNDDNKLKIGNYQAKEVNETWHIFDKSDQINSTSTIDISVKVALVMERYPYRIDIKLPNGFYLSNSDFTFFNQKDRYFKSKKPEKTLIFYQIPDCFRLSWSNGKKEFSSQFYFKEDETLNAFRKLKTLQKPNPLLLELKINNTNDSISAILKNDKSSVKILPSYMYVSPVARGNNFAN
ncbi:DUF2931 family protein [Flavobacterium sp. YJ01]|uniref:DUF2931 family protein n=1 Tax=unclassified Flavobacterium TaxID=196869 RepID=UPI0023E445F8|nr:DUF2931 family protein [Flavobacterium sp. YJ01]WET01697.1 DUF2931 family protein [Flavobacterium sp. YJ01]